MSTEVHTSITSDSSGSQIKFHNPGRPDLDSNAGQPVLATVKTPGNPNSSVQGQVPNTSIVFRNPA